jgi:hypothetical protein
MSDFHCHTRTLGRTTQRRSRGGSISNCLEVFFVRRAQPTSRNETLQPRIAVAVPRDIQGASIMCEDRVNLNLFDLFPHHGGLRKFRGQSRIRRLRISSNIPNTSTEFEDTLSGSAKRYSRDVSRWRKALRFHIALIEPNMRISRIRLAERFQGKSRCNSELCYPSGFPEGSKPSSYRSVVVICPFRSASARPWRTTPTA